MITTANYLVESRTIDFAKLPAPIRDTHETLLAGSENGAEWKSFTADPDVREVLGLYLEKLNQAVKPKRKANPGKLTTARRASQTMAGTDRLSSSRRGLASTTGTTRKATRPVPTPPADADVIILMPERGKAKKSAVAMPTAKAGKILGPRTTKKPVTPASATKQSLGVDPKKTRPAAPRTKQSLGAAPETRMKAVRSTKQSSEKPTITKAQKKEALREGVETAQQAAIRNLTAAQVIAIGKRINEKRFRMEIDGVMYDVREDFDTPTTNKQRLAPTGENLVKWAQKPGRYDLIGVDAAGRVDVTVFKKRDKDKVPVSMTRKPRIRAMKNANDRQKRTRK